jgi:hypothetical protein
MATSETPTPKGRCPVANTKYLFQQVAGVSFPAFTTTIKED